MRLLAALVAACMLQTAAAGLAMPGTFSAPAPVQMGHLQMPRRNLALRGGGAQVDRLLPQPAHFRHVWKWDFAKNIRLSQ
jgi:hypothetical protein